MVEVSALKWKYTAMLWTTFTTVFLFDNKCMYYPISCNFPNV